MWQGRPWLGTIVFVVRDTPDLLVSYLPEDAPFGFPEGDWPGDGRHPWHGRGAWEGHGVLMLQRPGESYAVWQVTEILAEGERIGGFLDAGERWWDEAWSRWQPPADWIPPPLPKGWDVV